jgi:hypothetical protein
LAPHYSAAAGTSRLTIRNLLVGGAHEKFGMTTHAPPTVITTELPDAKANRPWRWMLAVDAVIAIGGILFTVFADSPRYPGYMHLLVTYHFGFVRRALIGTILSAFIDKVPLWYVYAIATVAWLVALALFVAAFRKAFGFKQQNFSLFVFMIGSPFFFKNFAIALGHFDIYGCIWALVALLIPASSLYPLIIAAGCVVLILIHHLQFLLYIPTIVFIVLVRYGILQSPSLGKAIYGLILVSLVLIAFVAAALFGRMPVPVDTFLAYVSAHASDPIDPSNAVMWYSTIGQEVSASWERLPLHALRFPVYAVLIALHLPVARTLKSMIAGLPTVFLRSATVAAVAAISLGYVAIGVVAHDYSRWVSSWAVCMFLTMHAVRLLPSSKPGADPPLRADKTENVVLGWIVTVIPRVGIAMPF